jgi:hypothetical protein
MTSADYLDKSPAAGRMGKASEYLIAAACILSTRGELNVSTSMVDDEGVDLVFHRRDGVATLAVQVKARMSDAKDVQDDKMVAFVRSQTFRKRADLDILFVAVDIARGAVLKAWLIRSTEFGAVVEPDHRGRLRFVASMKQGTQDRWASHRLDADQLAPAILARLKVLEASGTVSCPGADAPLDNLLGFAGSYDGYRRLGGDPSALQGIVEPVLRELETSETIPDWAGLDLLRGTLFFIARQTRLWGDVPPEQERHMRLLVAAIGRHAIAQQLPDVEKDDPDDS